MQSSFTDLVLESSNESNANGGGGHPLIYFLDPVRRSLNYVLPRFGYTQIYMAGLSGGGWTTTFYAALDTRITTSVPVAGSAPFYMRFPSDAEQEDNPIGGNDFFNFTSGGAPLVTGYKDLYLLGAYGSGRRQIQVLNRNDDCCFGQPEYAGDAVQWDQAVRSYEQDLRQRVQALGAGSFRVEINEADDCVVQGNCGTASGPLKHEFSKNTRVGIILSELEGDHALLGATGGSPPFARAMNGHLLRNTSPGSWTDTGLAMAGTPAVVSGAIAGHTFDVFYRSSADRLTHAFFNGTAWVLTTDVSGIVISDPAAVSWGSGRIDVVAIGNDYRLYHWRYNGSWSPVELVHGTAQAVGAIAVTSAGPNHLDILFRGHDAGLYHIGSNGGPPFSLENTGGVIKGFPAAVSTTGTLLAYTVGPDDHLHEARQSNGGPWTWTDVSNASGSSGTKVLGSPSAFRATTGTVSVYSRVAGSQPNQLGLFTLANPGWTFSNAGGAPRMGAPIANSLGAFIVDPTNQSVWRFDAQGWHSLGSYVDR